MVALSERAPRKQPPLPLAIPPVTVRGGLVNALLQGWFEADLAGYQTESCIRYPKVDIFRTNPPRSCHVYAVNILSVGLWTSVAHAETKVLLYTKTPCCFFRREAQ